MGSLFQLEYEIQLKGPEFEKGMIDEMRYRNGNLKITCCRMAAARDVL